MAAATCVPTTLAIRVCSGAFLPGCGREYARERWEWSGAAVVTSHGLCPDCFRRERAALDALGREDDAS
jgi:hypothetical protein